MTTPTPTSAWISSIAYRMGYLALFLRCEDIHDPPVALLYGPSLEDIRPIPSWLPGLLAAGTGKRSIGRAYNTLVKGRYAYQRVEGWKQVADLRRMMRDE